MMNTQSDTRDILIQFRHGLGDAVQLTSVLRHLREDRPDWNVDVAALVGKHSAFHGLCRNVFVLDREEVPSCYDRVFDLDWPECPACYDNCPSTKAECCLRDVFRITPRSELCRYSIARGQQAMQEAGRYLKRICKTSPGGDGRFRAVLIHYEGNTSAGRKNLDVEIIRALCEDVIRLGFVPGILDWDDRSPLLDDERIFNPHADLDIWGRTGTGDAEVLAALIEQSTLMIGVDSGPLHVAGATSTPTIAVWTGHHPVHYFSPADNVLHLVPEQHADFLRRNRAAGLAYFDRNYRHHVYDNLEPTLTAMVREQLAGQDDRLVRSHGFWVRRDNVEQDLVVVRDIVQDDSYRVDDLPLSGPVVVDVGAHIGCFARRFHERNPTAKIIAVECCPENLPALRKNVETIATVVEGAVTYEADVALLNAVYPDCVSTGGSTVVGREDLQHRLESGEIGECPEEGGRGRYWADFRSVRTWTLEDLLEEHDLGRIDVLKLDCEGSEFSILENTSSLDRIGVIVGEFHGRSRFDELVGRRFRDWEFTIFRDEDPGTFRLVNPRPAVAVQSASALTDLGRSSSGTDSGVASANHKARRTPRKLPPMLVSAMSTDPVAHHLLHVDDGRVVARCDHSQGWLRGFAWNDGTLWTIDARGGLFRVAVGTAGIELKQVARSTLAWEAHDLAFHNGRLITAAPPQNAIVSYDLGSGAWSARHPWMPSAVPREGTQPAPDGDRHHVNSVLPDGDGFLLSIFSGEPKPFGTRWRGGKLDEGRIVRWGPNGFDAEPLATGIFAPHSLRRHRGQVWWCDSFRHTLCRSDGWRSPDLGGFARGIAFFGDQCAVGLSRSRVDPYPESQVCGVCVFAIESPEERHVVELDWPLIEVYDVVVLEA